MNIYEYIDQPTSQRQQTVYLRTNERIRPSQPLQPYFDARPVMTKYSILPTTDYRKPVATPVIQQPTYSQERIFNPGSRAPWSGYSVNSESELRNQIYPLQSCSQATYIPSSKSSLYDVKWNNNNIPSQPFPSLFKEESFSGKEPMHKDIGYALFNNATRQQLKDLTKQTKLN